MESRDGKWFVRVKNGERFETREVKIGMSDNLHVAVLEGLKAGEEVAYDKPSRHSQQSQLRRLSGRPRRRPWVLNKTPVATP